jgi:hypothetical protein
MRQAQASSRPTVTPPTPRDQPSQQHLQHHITAQKKAGNKRSLEIKKRPLRVRFSGMLGFF